ncbi:hypothetical protein CHARACLAT_011325 [Characodon lateralis]|uniref:Uncharacterized protein n=1 Tax=Characodon lateralis TaxID=208331 RepID=A0ABU7EUD2_9TELE|nr:hypothetical protein [Characodon lateralis]
MSATPNLTISQKKKTKKTVIWAHAALKLRSYAYRLRRTGNLSILEKSMTAVQLRTFGLPLSFPDSYTDRLKQDYNKGKSSFQSSCGANRREGAWWVCAPRNRWKQSGLTQAVDSRKT